MSTQPLSHQMLGKGKGAVGSDSVRTKTQPQKRRPIAPRLPGWQVNAISLGRHDAPVVEPPERVHVQPQGSSAPQHSHNVKLTGWKRWANWGLGKASPERTHRCVRGARLTGRTPRLPIPAHDGGTDTKSHTPPAVPGPVGSSGLTDQRYLLHLPSGRG